MIRFVLVVVALATVSLSAQELEFDVVASASTGDFTATRTKAGLKLGGEAPEFGNYLMTQAPVPLKGFSLDFTFTDAPGDSNEYEYWASVGLMDNPVYMTGDPDDTSGKGIVLLFFQQRLEGASDTYVLFKTTPGLGKAGRLKLPGLVKGRAFHVVLKPTTAGWEFDIGGQKNVVGYDLLARDVFPDDAAFLFAGTHTTKGVPVYMTLQKINGKAVLR